MRKELRASLEDARNRVAELETQNLDAKLEIDSLKASPVVSDEIDCCDCSVYLADLTSLKDKHASACEELDVLRVEVAELKSRPALLGACTFCPILLGKIDEMHAYTISLEAKLKEPILTSCSTCELHALKNLSTRTPFSYVIVVMHIRSVFMSVPCWGDSESSLSFNKNKRVSLVAQVSMRKAQQ
jgi:hypothetical protein